MNGRSNNYYIGNSAMRNAMTGSSATELRKSVIPADKIWIAVFISSFLGLFVDDFDLQMLSLTLPALGAAWLADGLQTAMGV